MATSKSKEKSKKTISNNEWAGPEASCGSKYYQDKTATNNEWVSTNKVVESEDQL